MSAEYFIDTNIFIYQLEQQDDRKAELAKNLIQQGIAEGTACISFQIVQECLNVILHKAKIVLTEDETQKYLPSILAPLYQLQPNIQTYSTALNLRSRYKYRFYDSLILATALEADCRTLYSEDLQHGQRIEQLTIKNPFQE